MLFKIFVMLCICVLVSLVQNLKHFIEELHNIHLEKIDADKKLRPTVARFQTCQHLPQLSVFLKV